MTTDLPFFSVIIPTYARPLQLAGCLASLAGLNYPHERFEVVVVDDGSETSPEDSIKDFHSRLNLRLLTQAHAGPAAARNFGASHARGEFLAFTDDDCTPAPDWLWAFAAHFKTHSDRLVGGQTLNALSRNSYAATSQLIVNVVYEHFNADPDDASFFASNNFAISNELFHHVGGFDETFRTSEDRELCDRWRWRGYHLTYAREALVYHAHPLTFRTLWRQHFGYGRGASRFHRTRTARGTGELKPDWNFYFKLLTSPLSNFPMPRALILCALVVWSQLASVAGFFYERSRAAKMNPISNA
jgi:glycosyltransferase involved in cell wall biosynthesis